MTWSEGSGKQKRKRKGSRRRKLSVSLMKPPRGEPCRRRTTEAAGRDFYCTNPGRDSTGGLVANEYAETGEKMIQVKTLDENGIQQGEAVMLTETQADEYFNALPDGWTVEEVR